MPAGGRAPILATVKAAVLHEHGSAPRFGAFTGPSPKSGHVVIDVTAAALHHLDLHKATGTFYTGPPPLPSVVGTDGVGQLGDGRRVYFDTTVAPYGSMAERALAPEEALFEIADGVDDAIAAALGNTGLAAWLALAWRSRLKPGETVLVLGATGAVGTVAVQAAKILGAGRVVAAARPNERLARLLERGADAIVELDGDGDLAASFRQAATARSTSRSTPCGGSRPWPRCGPQRVMAATSRSVSSRASRSASRRPRCARCRSTSTASRSRIRRST